ncbi:MAG: phosphate transport regulator [Flavipsychrobacter sp.]|nr:phosphate transport regulator [Flavipsychrobacter sp.]
MGFDSVLKFFLPKDKVFYSLFEEVSDTLVQMGDVFKGALQEQDLSKRDEMLRSLENWEHKNDDTTHRLFVELGRNFITPFDREDIHYLATSLDDIADYTWGAAKRIVNYQITDQYNTLPAFAEIISKSIVAINTSIHALRDMKDLRAITEACVLVNSLENDADDLLDSTMMKLFSSNISAMELIKQKDIYQMLETVTDKCEDAANVVETIIIKYS